MITVCLLLIGYEMFKRDRARTKEPSRAERECTYYFGFLSEYPLTKPIPNECFGCVLALSCVKAAKPKSESGLEERTQTSQLQLSIL